MSIKFNLYKTLGKGLDALNKTVDKLTESSEKGSALDKFSVNVGRKISDTVDELDKHLSEDEGIESFSDYNRKESKYTQHIDRISNDIGTTTPTKPEPKKEGEKALSKDINSEIEESKGLGSVDNSQLSKFYRNNGMTGQGVDTSLENKQASYSEVYINTPVGEGSLIEVLNQMETPQIKTKDKQKNAYKILYENGKGFYITTTRIYSLNWDGTPADSVKNTLYVINSGSYGEKEDIALSLILTEIGSDRLSEIYILIERLKNLV